MPRFKKTYRFEFLLYSYLLPEDFLKTSKWVPMLWMLSLILCYCYTFQPIRPCATFVTYWIVNLKDDEANDNNEKNFYVAWKTLFSNNRFCIRKKYDVKCRFFFFNFGSNLNRNVFSVLISHWIPYEIIPNYTLFLDLSKLMCLGSISEK